MIGVAIVYFLMLPNKDYTDPHKTPTKRVSKCAANNASGGLLCLGHFSTRPENLEASWPSADLQH